MQRNFVFIKFFNKEVLNLKVKNLIESAKRFIIGMYVAVNRKRIINDYFKDHSITKLHLGCGSNILDSWLNSDLHGDQNKILINVTKHFPFEDSIFNYIFFEHLIEHLDYLQGLMMLEECFRVLKPGGKIRIASPDLKFLVELYNERKTKLQKEYVHWAVDSFLNIKNYQDAFVINNFFKDWGHEFIYDFKTIKMTLRKIGFVDIKCLAVEESKDPNLRGLESHGKIIGEKYNILETFVVEANKPGIRRKIYS